MAAQAHNPFNPSTTIRFELPRTSHVTLSVYDILGRQLKEQLPLTERRTSMKKMILVVSIIGILLAQETTSQWAKTAGPEGGRAARLVTTSTCVLLGLEGGTLYRSTDHGTTWSSPESGLGVSVGNVSGFALIGTAVFASTTGNGVFRSTDDGLSWTTASGDLPSFGTYVAALAAKGDNLFVATYGGVYRSTNGGSSWVQANAGLPADTTFNALQVNVDNLLVGSDEGAGIFVSTNDGTIWTRSSTGLSGEGLRVLSLAASGGTVVAGTREGAFWSTDNGTNWTLCSSGLVSFAVSTLLASGSDFIAGTYGSGAFRSTNGGVDWFATNNNLGNTNVRALTTVGVDLLAGTYGPDVVYRSTNAGADWNGVGRGIAGEGIYSLVARGGKVVAASYTGVRSTTNQGSAWGRADSGMAGMTVYSLALGPDDILAGTTGHGVYRSTDEGTSWFPANTGLNGNARTVWAIAVDGTNLYAATSSGVFRSTNDGAQWVQTTNGIPDSLVVQVFAINGILFAATRSSVYRSTDSGQNWTAATAGLPQPFEPQEFARGVSSVFVAEISGVYRSTDNGDLWTPVITGLPSSPDIRTLFSYDRPIPFGPTLFAGLNYGGVYLSSDEGTNWTEVDAGLTDAGLSIRAFAADFGYLYAGTYASSVWKRPLSQILVSVNAGRVALSEYAVSQNYPNPFNPSTTITYELPRATHVSLSVYDILGRELVVLVNERREAGVHEVKFDGSAFASGVYFYRLSAAGFVATKRLLMLK
jgi:photosystem II stability/assembly factor-like uncharacterized protein